MLRTSVLYGPKVWFSTFPGVRTAAPVASLALLDHAAHSSGGSGESVSTSTTLLALELVLHARGRSGASGGSGRRTTQGSTVAIPRLTGPTGYLRTGQVYPGEDSALRAPRRLGHPSKTPRVARQLAR